MAYEKKSIRIIIDNINKRYIYIPSIQRKYICNYLQITKLSIYFLKRSSGNRRTSWCNSK